MENKEMSQEKIESPDEKLIQHSESNGFVRRLSTNGNMSVLVES